MLDIHQVLRSTLLNQGTYHTITNVEGKIDYICV